MFVRRPIIIFLCLLPFPGLAQNDSIEKRIILIGDAGKIDNGEIKELELVKKLFSLQNNYTDIVFLGDNIYPTGLPAAGARDYSKAKDIIDKQIELVKGTTANAFFVPGNHDWKQGAEDGWKQIQHESNYINSLDLTNVHLFPESGCPGPVEISLSEHVVLVIMDSQWWLQPYDKPGITSDCECKTKDQVITRLGDIVASNKDKILIFATHHPMITYGKHGGYFTLKQHIFPLTEWNKNAYVPLPVIGSLYPISRSFFGNIQDTKNPVYKNMRESIEKILDAHPYCIRVAGHDHNLQWIQLKDQNYIVSGAGSGTSKVKKGKGSLFADATTGFAVLEILKNGKVLLKFFSSVAKDNSVPLFTGELKNFDRQSAAVAALAPRPTEPDSVLFPGYPAFRAGAVKRFFFGSNYRKEWQTPVKAQVFDITTLYGGLHPLRRGGGNQTVSLRLADSSGKEYVLRSIEKKPTEDALPVALQGTFVIDLVTDGVSSSYPYAALSVPPFAEAVGVPHAKPSLWYVPDDPAFGIYQRDFGNTLSFLEEREPGDDKKTLSTENVVKKLTGDNDNIIDQQAVLRARILDIFIMDFDRHEDQWRWGHTENKKIKTWYPVPRDRDQPFFINRGLVPHIAGLDWISPQLQGFTKHARNIRTYNYNARNFDRTFLSEPDRAAWQKESAFFLTQMTDALIDSAIALQPNTIMPTSAKKITGTLKARRKYLTEELMTYYSFLAKSVNVVGSDKKELFDVERIENGNVKVIEYKMNSSGEQTRILFRRLFIYSETKEICLYGMGGDDKFFIHGNATKTIKLRIIGGQGDDKVTVDSSNLPASKTIVYDLSSEKGEFTGNMQKKLSADPIVNEWNRLGFKYNVIFPQINFNYNRDDGISLGISAKYTEQGFHKEPFKLQHHLTISHSLETKAYHFNYGVDIINAIGKLDVLVKTNLNAPNNTVNFFGLGNETVIDKSTHEWIKYYRTRFTTGDGQVLLRKRISPVLSIAAGPTFYFFTIDRNDNDKRFINYPQINKLDSIALFQNKQYLGGNLAFSIDSRNNKILPERGVKWETSFDYLLGLNNYSQRLAKLNTDLCLYTSFSTRANIVFATRFGAGFNFGNYEFFQAQTLGGPDNLRGYRKDRFSGGTTLFNNTELRIKLIDFRTYLFPGKIGMLIFNDAGRVWVKDQTSSKWHDGYGGGLWFSPLGTYVIACTYTRSGEGPLPLISFGFQF